MLFLANSIISQHIVSRIRFLQCFFVSSRHIFTIIQKERIVMIGNISIKIFDSLPTTNLLLISDSDYESNQLETEENHQYSIVPKETFIELQRFSGEWKYTDNSYYMDDNNESYTETKKISCGFFQYMNSNWYNKTGSFMKSLIIKCRYEELKDGNIAVLFTPFVVVKSIRYENAVNICRKLYADTEIGKWLENTTERISYVLLLNLIECFTNLYTWILFESKLKIYFNTSEIKLDLLQNNLNPVFLDTIKMMFTWKQINFESRIEQVNKIGNIATWTQEKNNNVSLNTIEEVYELLYQQVIEMKREKNTDNFVTIEQMENMVSQQNQELLTGSLLQMLDQDILEQNTMYQNGMILHVFRCGNNSDIVLPFYNPYIMYAVYLFYLLRCQLNTNEEKTKEAYFSGIHDVFNTLRKLVKANDSMNILFTNEALDKNERYFSDQRADLYTLVENKSFRVYKDKRIKIVEKLIKNGINNISAVGADME